MLAGLDGMQQQRAALAAEVATHAAEKQRLEADLAALQVDIGWGKRQASGGM